MAYLSEPKQYVCEKCNGIFTRRKIRPNIRFCSRLCANRGIGKKKPRHQPVEDRFWSKVQKTENCWLWMARLDKDGYGTFKVDGKMYRAHRFSYQLAYGVSLGTQVARHICDNPQCIRPDHILPGSPKDNYEDARQRGRNTTKATRMKKAQSMMLTPPADEPDPGPGGPGVPGDERPRGNRHPSSWERFVNEPERQIQKSNMKAEMEAIRARPKLSYEDAVAKMNELYG